VASSEEDEVIKSDGSQTPQFFNTLAESFSVFEKLHYILSQDKYKDIIGWMPHWRCFRILDSDKFVLDIAGPKYLGNLMSVGRPPPRTMLPTLKNTSTPSKSQRAVSLPSVAFAPLDRDAEKEIKQYDDTTRKESIWPFLFPPPLYCTSFSNKESRITH
jgi:hypothetical protein